MKILCIVDQYYPESSANTSCMNVLMQKFMEEGDVVDFLSFRQNVDSDYITKFEHGSIIKFDSYRLRFLTKYKKMLKSQKWLDVPWFIRKIVSGFQRIKTKIFHKDFPLEIDSYCLKNVKQLLTQNGNEYDIIISSSSPFSLHMIAENLLNMYKKAKWYPVFLDPFVYNFCLPQNQVNKRKRIAERYLKKADKIFMQRGIKAENISNNYNPEYHSRVIDITLPNLVDNTKNSKPEQQEKINLLYSGIFYEDIRNPKKMLDVLDNLGDIVSLTLLSKFCDDIINNFISNGSSLNINMLGFRPREEALQRTQNANILINLSNTITNQMPSKVFEYIGMGKPVINFYWSENDTSLFYFKKYPLAFNFNLNSYSADDIKNLKEFCVKNKDTFLTFEEATQNLKEETSDVVCSKFFNEVKNGKR